MKFARNVFLWLAAGVLPWLATAPLPAQIPFTGNYFLHDPSTMIKSGSSYFIYGDGQGILGITSTDLRNWSATSTVFPTNLPPAWISNSVPGFTGYFWAPDIAFFNGRYNLYYAGSIFGTRNSIIGVVTSPSLTSPVWTDQGKVVQSDATFSNPNTDTTSFNCIDPAILLDTNGSVWMAYGSYSDGILVTQIDPATGLRQNPASVGTKVASSTATFNQNTTEGSFLYQRGGFYYLFLNYGGCCAGASSTYNIRVGRSTSVTGPYLDKGGANMLTGGGTMVLESTGRFIGPGHPGILNDNGTNWFTYHYYDAKNNGAATVGMSRLYWDAAGWPAVTNDWSAFYTFSTDAREHLALYNATLQNNAVITNDASRGKVLNLDGVTNVVSFPLSVANASTFTAWVKWNGGADWQRIFDFGTNTSKYFFLTPRGNTGVMRFAIKNGGAEQQINAPTAMPTNSWCHVAVSLDGSKGILYLNGNPVGTNNALNIRPWQLLARSNYVGQSQFAGDPYFNGRIGSLRIFGRPLGALEIRDLAWTHPYLAHRYSFTSGTTNVWDSIGLAHGTLAGDAVITNNALKLSGNAGSYVNLPGGLVSGSSALTVEFWATFGVNGNYARVFDFGNINGAFGAQYVFFSPHTGTGAQRTEIATSSTVTFDIPGTLDNRIVHVACIVDPASSYMAIYTNGVLEKSLAAALPVLTGVNKSWGFIGRSLWSSDAYLNATIDELRIYDGRLTPQEIATDFQFGPDNLALPVTITPTNSPANLTLSWPSWAAGFAPQGSADLLNWTTNNFSPTLANDLWTLLISKTNAANFYRLKR
jgi:beta-xylosidase